MSLPITPDTSPAEARRVDESISVHDTSMRSARIEIVAQSWSISSPHYRKLDANIALIAWGKDGMLAWAKRLESAAKELRKIAKGVEPL